MSKNLSPEERLLHLIRRHDKPEAENKPAPPPQAAVLENPVRILPEEAKAKKRFRLSFNFGVFNFLLVLGAIILVGYLGLEIFKLKEEKITLSLPRPSSLEEDKKEEEPPEKPYAYYSKEIGQKELFKTSILQGEEKPTAAAGSSTLADLSANLTLLGIVLDDRAQAIIQDKKTQKSYFLYKGNSIGEIKVEDILESKVILSYQGEKIELVP